MKVKTLAQDPQRGKAGIVGPGRDQMEQFGPGLTGKKSRFAGHDDTPTTSGFYLQ